MSDGDIERIMQLAFCSEEDARHAFSKTQDVVDAVDMLLEIPPTKGAPKPKQLSEEQKAFTQIRKDMEKIDRANETLMKTSQHDSSFPMLSHTLGLVQEEMSLHSDRILESHLPTQEEVAQKSETVYR
jgi:hypothetical protein